MNSSFSLNLSHNSLISVNDSNILSNNFSLASRFTDTVTWSLGAVGNYASRAVNEVFDALMLSEDRAGSPAGSQDRSVHRSLTSTRETTARGSRSGRNGRAPESGNTVTTRSTSTTVSRTSPSRPPSSATSRDKVKEKPRRRSSSKVFRRSRKSGRHSSHRLSSTGSTSTRGTPLVTPDGESYYADTDRSSKGKSTVSLKMAHSHLPQSILKRGRQVSDSRGTAIEISGDTIYPDKGVRITSPAVTKTAVPSPSSAFPTYLVDSVALTVQPGPSGISQSSKRLASHNTEVTSTTGPSQPVPKERLSDSSGTSLQPSVPNPPGENHWLRLTPSSYPSQATATGPSAQDFEGSPAVGLLIRRTHFRWRTSGGPSDADLNDCNTVRAKYKEVVGSGYMPYTMNTFSIDLENSGSSKRASKGI